MDNLPIVVTNNGVPISEATDKDLLLNPKYPFTKIDSLKDESFRIITMTFNSEPPDPATPTSTATFSNTLIYSYSHGYNHVPSTWFLISIDGMESICGQEGVPLLIGGAIPGSSYAQLNVTIDEENINFYIKKRTGYVFGTPDSPIHIQGYVVTIRLYIFVDDLSGNSLPLSY